MTQALEERLGEVKSAEDLTFIQRLLRAEFYLSVHELKNMLSTWSFIAQTCGEAKGLLRLKDTIDNLPMGQESFPDIEATAGHSENGHSIIRFFEAYREKVHDLYRDIYNRLFPFATAVQNAASNMQGNGKLNTRAIMVYLSDSANPGQIPLTAKRAKDYLALLLAYRYNHGRLDADFGNPNAVLALEKDILSILLTTIFIAYDDLGKNGSSMSYTGRLHGRRYEIHVSVNCETKSLSDHTKLALGMANEIAEYYGCSFTITEGEKHSAVLSIPVLPSF
jgi:hypothetical protein